MMHAAMMGALIVSGVAGIGMMTNEATHGEVAGMMGLGHHHMADVGGYHCASHSGEQGPHHMDHMHNETHSTHNHCQGGGSMHGHNGGRGGM